MINTQVDERSFASVLTETGLSDRDLSALFQVNQSTISRLRAGKIRRTAQYAAQLQASGLMHAVGTDGLDEALSGLKAAARKTPALASLLCILHKLIIETVGFDGAVHDSGKE